MKKFLFATGAIALLYALVKGKSSNVDVEIVKPELPTGYPVKPAPGGLLTPKDVEVRSGYTEMATNTNTVTPSFKQLNPFI